MRPVTWSARAREDLAGIVGYISEHDPVAARRLADEIKSSTRILPDYPNIYPASGRMQGCREIVVHKKYMVIYRVEPDRVRVLRVIHGSRIHF